MAVVRVKRRLTEEPAEALFIACKRIRSDNDSPGNVAASENFSTVFTFAGTFNSKDNLQSPEIAEVLNKHQKNPKLRVVDILNRKRKEFQNAKKKNRLKVVNSYRTQLLAEGKELDPDKQSDLDLCVYDVEDDEDEKDKAALKNAPFLQDCSQSAISCNGVELIRENSSASHTYVYDLYYTKEFIDDGVILDSSFNIERYTDPASVDYRDDDSDHAPSDADDSNDENYYKNDYPDDDSDFENTGLWDDYKEDDVCNLFSKARLNSSDSDSDDSDCDGPQPSKEDIDLYGEDSARFRLKMLKEFNSEPESD